MIFRSSPRKCAIGECVKVADLPRSNSGDHLELTVDPVSAKVVDTPLYVSPDGLPWMFSLRDIPTEGGFDYGWVRVA